MKIHCFKKVSHEVYVSLNILNFRIVTIYKYNNWKIFCNPLCSKHIGTWPLRLIFNTYVKLFIVQKWETLANGIMEVGNPKAAIKTEIQGRAYNWISMLKAVYWQNSFLLRESQPLFYSGLLLFGWGPPSLRKAICPTQSWPI